MSIEEIEEAEQFGKNQDGYQAGGNYEDDPENNGN
jgi:hypothetical protein